MASSSTPFYYRRTYYTEPDSFIYFEKIIIDNKEWHDYAYI